MARWLVTVMLCSVLLGIAATPAQAQRVFVRAGGVVVEIRTAPEHLGEVIRTWAIPGDAGYNRRSRVVGAGRYLLLDTFRDTVVVDTVSGVVMRPNLGHVIGVAGDGTELVTYDVPFSGRPVVEVVTIATGARRPVNLPSGCILDVAVAERARVLAVRRADSCPFGRPPSQWIDLVSLDDAPIRERVVDVAPTATQTSLTINPAGTRLWLTTANQGSLTPGIVAFDLVAGRELAGTSALTLVGSPDTQFLPGRNLLLSVTTAGLTVLEPESLQVLTTLDVARNRLEGVLLPPGYRSYFGYTVLAHDDAEAAFVYEYSGMAVNYGGGPCLQAALIALDSRTGQRLGSRDARVPTSGEPFCGLDLALAVPPPAPNGLQASVVAGRVTLTWAASPEATHYEVEVGSAAGLRNLAVFVSGSPTLVGDNVPSGTYHVRVRALNFAGKGAYTRDLPVTVP